MLGRCRAVTTGTPTTTTLPQGARPTRQRGGDATTHRDQPRFCDSRHSPAARAASGAQIRVRDQRRTTRRLRVLQRPTRWTAAERLRLHRTVGGIAAARGVRKRSQVQTLSRPPHRTADEAGSQGPASSFRRRTLGRWAATGQQPRLIRQADRLLERRFRGVPATAYLQPDALIARRGKTRTLARLMKGGLKAAALVWRRPARLGLVQAGRTVAAVP
jgi:hypothetical protein